MRTRRLIKSFRFEEAVRADIDLGPGARLHPDRHLLTLVGAPGAFPTDDDIQARTPLWEPASARGWLGFMAVDRHPVVDGRTLTRLAYRLSDGNDDYWWNGSAWAITTAIDGEWSIEEDVAVNIGAFFAIGARKLQVIVNLKSDDVRVAPELLEIKVLWASDIEPQEDLVLRSLIPDLKAKLRPRADATVDYAAATPTIAVADLALEAKYDVTEIDSIFNHTDDPDHLDDLLASYDANTKVATLTAPLAAGKRAWVRFLYRPLVAITTSQDYDEVGAVPAVIIRDVEATQMSERAVPDMVANRATGDGVVVPAPIQGDLNMRIEWHTEKQVDHQRLADEIKRYFGTTPILRSRGLGEDFRLWLVSEYATAFPPDGDQRDLLRGELEARIVGALLFHKEARDEKAILAFRLSGTEDATIVAMQRVFWGGAVLPGSINGAFVQGLDDNAFARTAARVFNATAGANEYLWFSAPVSFGTPHFKVNGFDGGFFKAADDVDVDGVLYDVWRSDAHSLGPTTVVVS